MNESKSTTLEKLTVCGTSFACSCGAFVVSVLLLIPFVGAVMQAWQFPEVVQQVVVLFTLIGVPIIGALWGIKIGAEAVLAKRAESAG